MLLFLNEDPPAVLPAAGEHSLPFYKAVAALCDCSAAALEAVVVLTRCNEVLLSSALAFTNAVSVGLSGLLRLNSLLGRMLAAVLWSCRPAGPGSERGGSSAGTLRGWTVALSWLRAALHAAPRLWRCSLSVCTTLIHLAQLALSALQRGLRPGVSTVKTVCGCVRSLLSTLQTVTGLCSLGLGLSP